MEKILIIGGGGHAKSLIDNIFSSNIYQIIGIVDKNKPKGQNILGIPIIGNDEDLKKIFNEGIINAAIGIGSSGDNRTRNKVYSMACNIGFNFPSIIHSKSYISKFSTLKNGVQVFANSVINANTTIHNNTVINSNNTIEHDCVIKENVFTGPGIVVCGNSIVKSNVFIGSNSTLTPNSKIEKNCFISANTLVT